MGESSFESFGFRIPFLLSGILVALALYIRWSLRETPLFTRLKETASPPGSRCRTTSGTEAGG